ncbi:hypothetical protein ACVWWD_005723 [Mesorhizobium sp. URHB0026]
MKLLDAPCNPSHVELGLLLPRHDPEDRRSRRHLSHRVALAIPRSTRPASAGRRRVVLWRQGAPEPTWAAAVGLSGICVPTAQAVDVRTSRIHEIIDAATPVSQAKSAMQPMAALDIECCASNQAGSLQLLLASCPIQTYRCAFCIPWMPVRPFFSALKSVFEYQGPKIRVRLPEGVEKQRFEHPVQTVVVGHECRAVWNQVHG